MTRVLVSAEIFEGDISNWNACPSKVGDLYGTFVGARLFNVDLSKWDATA